jgi:hypothetical protein
MKEKDFTRKRKLSFCATLLLMFNLLRKSLAIEIDTFVSHFNDGASLGNTSSFTSTTFI